MNIVFFGRESGLIVRKKLQEAGFDLVDIEHPQVDLIVVGFYGKILSKKTLDTATYGALNIHPSLLPQYRGPSPVQATILHGESRTGVSIILMDEQIDHGPIIATQNFEIGTTHYTTPTLTQELWELGGDLLVKTIPQWIAGNITPRPQDESKATYTNMLRREDGRIDWSNPALYIERQIRAFSPWPGTFTHFQSKLLKILKAKVFPLQGTPGQVFQNPEKELAVYTGEQALILQEVQPEGRKPMSGKEFLLGHDTIINQSFH